MAAARSPDWTFAIIDRALALARSAGLSPALCINKIDLADRPPSSASSPLTFAPGSPSFTSARRWDRVGGAAGCSWPGGGRRGRGGEEGEGEGRRGAEGSEAYEEADDQSDGFHPVLRPLAPSPPRPLPPFAPSPPRPLAPSVPTGAGSPSSGGLGGGEIDADEGADGGRRSRSGLELRGTRGDRTDVRCPAVCAAGGGFLADTPGFDWLHLDTLGDEEHPQEVLLPDSHLEPRRCRFANCTHRGEPGCAVTRGVLAGGSIRTVWAYLGPWPPSCGPRPTPAADREVAILGGELFHRLRDRTATISSRLWTALGKTSWCYYWPFLRLYGYAPNREVLWREVAGNRCLFVARHLEDGPRGLLLFPPLGPAPGGGAAGVCEALEGRQRTGAGRVSCGWTRKTRARCAGSVGCGSGAKAMSTGIAPEEAGGAGSPLPYAATSDPPAGGRLFVEYRGRRGDGVEEARKRDGSSFPVGILRSHA